MTKLTLAQALRSLLDQDEGCLAVPGASQQLIACGAATHVYTSPWHKGTASTSTAATGFSKGTYTLPAAGPGDNDDYITVDFKWWNAANALEGYVNISYDFYKGVAGSKSHVFVSHCGADF